jgi:uncharacterized protein (TIGR02172 family)
MQQNRIGVGRTAEVWEHGEGIVLKLYMEEFPAAAVEQEFKISTYVYELGIRTPRPLELFESEGRSGILFQQIHGRSLLRMIGEKPWQLSKYAKQLAALHHDLHQLEGDRKFGVYKEQLRRGIIAAPMLTMEEKTVILEQLEKLPEGTKLCHGDFHPDNVLLDEEAWIIDWMTGITGNPAADAARSVLLLSMGAMPPGTPFFTKLITNIMRQKLNKGYIREYLRLSGRTYAEINAWILPVAAARLIEGVPVAEKEQLAKEVRKRLRSIRKA